MDGEGERDGWRGRERWTGEGWMERERGMDG